MLARASVSWKQIISPLVRVETEAALLTNSRSYDAQTKQYRQDAAIRDRLNHSRVKDDGMTARGKLVTSLGEVGLAVGGDAQRSVRSDSFVQLESVPGQPSNLQKTSYQAVISQHAVFLLAEWEPSRNVSTSAGLRREQLATSVASEGEPRIEQRSSITIPSVQGLWKLEPRAGIQLRGSIGRAFRAPTPRDLLPKQRFFVDNSATNPDFSGNPGLRPEVASVATIGLERYRSPESRAFESLTLTYRSIEDVVVRDVFQAPDGTWSTTPKNLGAAWSATVTLESRGSLDSLLDSGRRIEYQATLAWSRSRIESIASTSSRPLPGQVPLLGQLTLEYSAPNKVRLGATAVFERTTWTATSLTNSRLERPRHTIDPYLGWKWKGCNMRVGITNLLAQDGGFAVRFQGLEGSMERRDVSFKGHRVIRVGLELPI
jgi:outer membrane receptor protein involved in Fe transport